MKKTINFVILTAGIGYKMRSYEPRSMLRFNKIPLIKHQINEINKLSDKFRVYIYVVTGYGDDKIAKGLAKEKVTIVNNPHYETCNQGGSIKLLLKEFHLGNAFLVHGDIYFKFEDINKLNFDSSFVLYDTEGRFKDKEVGVNIGDGLGSLSYGPKTKWSQMAYFGPNEMNTLYDPNLETFMLTHEVVNFSLGMGGLFRAEPFVGDIFEIDRIKEYKIEKFNFKGDE
jgi:CTP:phosphocholine cytidylyltransferase-like protein